MSKEDFYSITECAHCKKVTKCEKTDGGNFFCPECYDIACDICGKNEADSEDGLYCYECEFERQIDYADMMHDRMKEEGIA